MVGPLPPIFHFSRESLGSPSIRSLRLVARQECLQALHTISLLGLVGVVDDLRGAGCSPSENITPFEPGKPHGQLVVDETLG